ncbi:hypothetical protein B7L88_gp134 [Rhizobium phage RHEph10]|uniref:hypothetical protein n=1 Tax=Rhizobium phage RHEph10 TaxID=1220717 RepID=UPI0002AB13E2|nr:hypothetical protein B7L88_gp134 [Rhizobium phage RHEph10]AGC36154.1 hypothetical protein RHEph10_gp111 [Rhizobium phage RHEph10]
MIQEAVLDSLEGDRYIGFLVEQEEWRDVINSYGFAETKLVGKNWIWRITDRLTGNTTEGPIPSGTEAEVQAFFEETWAQFNNSPYRPPVPEVPIVPVDPYASHPNYGRF